jgi:CheY-like chemotaxis protein
MMARMPFRIEAVTQRGKKLSPLEAAWRAEPPMDLKKVRVLLLEDSPDSECATLRLLLEAAADVTLDCNGQSGVATMMSSLNGFDVILLDLHPVMSEGYKTAVQLRQHGYQGLIVGVGCDADGGLLRAGCDAIISKPLNLKVLLDALRQTVHKAGNCQSA